MTNYRAALDHDQFTFTAFDPQPRCIGLEYSRETPLGNGMYVEGLFFYLIWDAFEDASQYQAVLTVAGLVAARTREVTVYGPDDLYNDTRYNATAVRPRINQDGQRENFFLRGFRILFRDLQDLG